MVSIGFTMSSVGSSGLLWVPVVSVCLQFTYGIQWYVALQSICVTVAKPGQMATLLIMCG